MEGVNYNAENAMEIVLTPHVQNLTLAYQVSLGVHNQNEREVKVKPKAA